MAHPDTPLEGVEFEFSAITVRQWIDHVQATLPGMADQAEHWSAFFPLVVSALPKGWGNPRQRATYRSLRQFSQFEPLRALFDQAVMAARDAVVIPDGILFDLDAVTMAQWQAHTEAISFKPGRTAEEIFSHWWAFFPTVVTALPAEWGDPTRPATYEGLLYFDQFTALIAAFGEAVDDARKKASRMSI